MTWDIGMNPLEATMTTLDYDERARNFYQRLDAFIETDLAQLAVEDPDMATKMREAREAHRSRLRTEVWIAPDEESTNLHYIYDLFVDGTWYGLARMHWSLLMDDRADAIDEVRMTLRQEAIANAAEHN